MVFTSAALLDIVYVFWFTSVSEKKPWKAALSSVFIGICGMFGTLNVVGNHWMAIPYLLGLGFGTIAGMELKRRSKSSE